MRTARELSKEKISSKGQNLSDNLCNEKFRLFINSTALIHIVFI